MVSPHKFSIRIVAFSDWRSQDFEYLEQAVENISDIDLFIYGGDDINRLIQFESILKRLIDKTKQKKLLFVVGNDDIPSEKEEFARRDWTHDLDNEPYFLGRYAFFGNEGSADGLGFHQRTERQVTAQLQKQTSKAAKEFKNKKYFPIIVSHPPPYGILDMAIRHSSDGLARHIGSTSLKRFLDKHTVPLTICGHVHMWGGQTEELKNGNQVLNIASHDHSGADGRFGIINLSASGKVQITHSSLQRWFSDHEMACLSALSWKRF
jgi:Icc-related predicted phosphoesterase